MAQANGANIDICENLFYSAVCIDNYLTVMHLKIKTFLQMKDMWLFKRSNNIKKTV